MNETTLVILVALLAAWLHRIIDLHKENGE